MLVAILRWTSIPSSESSYTIRFMPLEKSEVTAGLMSTLDLSSVCIHIASVLLLWEVFFPRLTLNMLYKY